MARQPISPSSQNEPHDIASDADTDVHPSGKAPAHRDTVLESLGKAIIAPVKNTADPDDDPTTR